MNDPVSGVAGVGRASKIGTSSVAENSAQASDVAEGFGELLQRSIETVAKGEQVGLAGVAGAASTQDVVQAVMEAERTLQTALAVRNKVVEAYLEISRMQI